VPCDEYFHYPFEEGKEMNRYREIQEQDKNKNKEEEEEEEIKGMSR
jgi:hypothetical protein